MTRSTLLHRFAALALAVLCLKATGAMTADATPQPDILVFAAASLTDVMQQIGADYRASHTATPRYSFASTATLARQIEAGATADLFISADTQWMDYLDQRGLIQHTTRTDLLANGLVLICPVDEPVRLRIAKGFALRAALGRSGRMAIADPVSVPAGRYAKAALTTLGVWNTVADRIVPTENVRTSLLYVARGEVPLGIVYSTDARTERRVHVVDTFPPDSYRPITYPVALTRTARPGATDFLRYLESDAAAARFAAAGFTVLRRQPAGARNVN